MNDIKIEWHRWEFWVGDRRNTEKPDDPWSARFQGWSLSVDPLRRDDFDMWNAPEDVDPSEHIGWKWSVTPEDRLACPSYSGTVPSADALDEAKHEAECALKRRLASEAGP